MEQQTDLLALSLLAAVSVTVGLTSAGFANTLDGPRPGESGSLVETIASVLGLDQEGVADYLQGHPSEIRYGAAVLRSE